MRDFAKALGYLLACFVTIVAAAQETCPDIVLDALESMENACVGIGRNEACYGNGSIIALDVDGEELSDFAASGDTAEISSISNLSLSGLEEDEGLWGVAVLSVQADIPNTLPGQNVTMLLFGESELSTVEDDASAFVFSTGIGQLGCDEAPNGLLIQTPDGVGTINLTVNNIAIELGSTAFLSAEAEGEFHFALLEGHATLNSEESEVELNGGEFSTISLDEDLNPTGEFSEALPIEGNLELPSLPVEVLPRDISEESAASGEIIVPRSGTWNFETTNFEVSDACPAMLANALEQGMAQDNGMFTEFGGEGWDFETFYREATLESSGIEIPDGVFSSPEPNVYVFETAGGGDMSPYTFTMRIVSETEVQGSYFIDASEFFAGCTMSFDFSSNWSE